MSKLVVKLAFPGKDGKKIPVEFPVDGIEKLISDLLKVAEGLPRQASLTTEFLNDPNPPEATAFAVTPIENQPHAARLSIAIGEVRLQISVPLGPLLEALEALKQTTEPDPKSPLRPN